MQLTFKTFWLTSSLLLACTLTLGQAYGQLSLSLSTDMELDSSALVFPDTARFSRYPNGSPYRTEPILTFGNYQFATWYRADSNGDNKILIARRDLRDTSSNPWKVRDTGERMVDGLNLNGDSHNVISMGVSGDGRIHLAYDMHARQKPLRYLSSQAGRATTTAANWDDPNFTVFNAERDSLNLNGTTLSDITYPRFINNGDDMLFTYRVGGSGDGDVMLARYDSDGSTVHSRWVDVNGNNVSNVSQTFISGSGTYNGPVPSPSSAAPGNDHINSTSRNAYLNGVDVDPTGRIHATWTWREDSRGSNHDINYAYSDNNGETWNNSDDLDLGSVVSIDDDGIIVQELNLQQSLHNQQGQAVDNEGGVHALMYHRDPNKPWTSGEGNFFTGDAEYYHYYRDPVTGDWTRNSLPTNGIVGSRPSIGFDSENNLYAAYLTRLSAGGPEVLRIAGAEKLVSGDYDDWEILLDDPRDWAGTPLLDQTRLLNDDILSIYLQEDTNLTGRTGTSLRVLEYNILGIAVVPEPGSLTVLSALTLALLCRRRKRA